MADIKYLVEVDATGAVKSVKNFDDVLDDLKKNSAGAEGAHKSLWKQVALGQAVYDVAKKTGREFVDFLKDSVKASIESEDANNRLNSALESTGRTVGPLSEHFREYADQLMKQTVYDDEAIKGAQALLLQLTNLDQQGMDEATKGALGLATVMGTDLNSAARMVAQAYGGNFNALGRMVPAVREAKTESEKLAAVKDFLTKAFQRAQAETGTFGGKLKQLGNTYGEIKEAAGKLVTQNYAVMDSLSKIAEGIVYLANADDMLAGKDAILREQQNRQVEWLSKAAVAAGWHYGQMSKLIEAYQGNTAALTMAINKGKEGTAIQEALNKVVMEAHTIWDKEAEARKKAEQGTNSGTAADEKAIEARKKLTSAAQAIIDKARPLAAARRKIREEEEALDAAYKAGFITAELHAAGIGHLRVEYNNLVVPIASATDALLKFADAAGNKVIPGIRDIQTTSQKASFSISKSWAKSAQEWIEKNNEGVQEVFSQVTNFTSQIDALSQVTLGKRLAELDAEYQARLEAIKKSTMSEDEKNQAIEALESEYNMKRQQAQQKAASQQKLGAIAQAIISTYEAAAKALTAGPIIGPILMGIITAMGLLQVAKIRATPLAEGAIFRKPVFSPGAEYTAGEAGPEAVIPLRELPRIMRELTPAADRGGFGLNRPIIIQNRIILDGREMKAWTTKTVIQAGDLGKLGTIGKGFRQ